MNHYDTVKICDVRKVEVDRVIHSPIGLRAERTPPMDDASLPHSFSDSETDSSHRDSGYQAEDLWPFYSIGRPDDVLVSRDKTCQEISDLLGRAHDLGHSSFGEAASTLPDVPGLALEGLSLESCQEGRHFVRMQLAEALKKIKGGPDDAELSGGMRIGEDDKTDEQESVILAMMLSKECTQENIAAAGINSLSGVDCDRLRMLKDANALLPPGKQLVFYLARVWYELGSSIKGLEGEAWYSASGEKINSAGPGVSWTRRFSFLNPGSETLSQLWESGNRKTSSLHERFALVAWPASADIGNTVTLFGDLASVPLGAVIAELGDVQFVDAFCRKYVVHLKEKEKSLFIQWLPTLVQRFGWERVRSSLLAALDVRAQETRLSQALELADTLSDNASARRDLTSFAVGKARSWCLTRPEVFVSSTKIVKLLSHAMACASPPVFSILLALLQNLDGKLLRPVVDAFLACMDDSSLPEHRAALASVATKRRQWLANEIEDSKKPFAWSILTKDFPNAAAIEEFLLQDTNSVYEIRGFSGIAEARTQADLLHQKIQGSLQFVACGRGRDAYVQIVKAGGDYDTRRNEVPIYEAEMEGIDKLVRDLLPQDENVDTANTIPTTRTIGLKRTREDESDDLVFE
ncbi:hypothetical protein PHYSODRAFT_293695 [Phytophthora sojae]|uniref:Uncharacterized protein n=1 Tax=Phytophthora sojae (strain P6497) TaxID=1094619 RepID=G4YG11_PHYSP|nr:hypothetical protein PHYSODRAFT_293695 [Phytophthora sojae]EGZ28059.1 hypothetical protein PHYSODRAFT_293695 [Phytophthora sojae]|eukprot:XP_009515334.1 hypothetical protein PHYSODRAFT_293695 [Phytophthora sojae]